MDPSQRHEALRSAVKESVEKRAMGVELQVAEATEHLSFPEGAEEATVKIQSLHRGNVGRARAAQKKAGTLDDYAQEVKDRSSQFQPGVGVKFMVGVDGSDVAETAWRTAVHMMQATLLFLLSSSSLHLCMEDKM